MMKHLRSIVMLTMTLAVAAPAYAQLAEPKTRQGRPVRGLFGSGTGDTGQQLVLNVSFGAGYDKAKGGVASGGPGAPPIVYPDRSGSYGTGSVSLDYSLAWEKISAGASIGSNARFQPNQTQELSHSAGASSFVLAQLSKSTSLSASYGLSRQPHNLQMLYGSWLNSGSAPDVLMDLSGTTAQGNFISQHGGVSFSQGITSRISLIANYSYHQQGGWFGGPATRSSTQTASGGMSVAIFKFARVRIAYGTTTTRQGGVSTTTSYGGPMADGGLDFGRAISLSRRATFTFSTGVAGASDEGGSLHYLATGHAAFSYELGRSWTADANVRRGVDFNQGLGQPVVLDTVSVGVGGDLGRRIQLNAGSGIAFRAIGVGTTTGSGYTVSTARVSVRTALTRTLGVSVQYAFRHYLFDDPASLPPGLRPNSDRHTLRVSLDLSIPLITRARRANASR